MQDDIVFVHDWFAEVQDSDLPGRLRQIAFRKGDALRAEVRPVASGNRQLADLRLPDGSIALAVPRARFAVVVEQNARAA